MLRGDSSSEQSLRSRVVVVVEGVIVFVVLWPTTLRRCCLEEGDFLDLLSLRSYDLVDACCRDERRRFIINGGVYGLTDWADGWGGKSGKWNRVSEVRMEANTVGWNEPTNGSQNNTLTYIRNNQSPQCFSPPRQCKWAIDHKTQTMHLLGGLSLELSTEGCQQSIPVSTTDHKKMEASVDWSGSPD